MNVADRHCRPWFIAPGDKIAWHVERPEGSVARVLYMTLLLDMGFLKHRHKSYSVVIPMQMYRSDRQPHDELAELCTLMLKFVAQSTNPRFKHTVNWRRQ